MAVVRRHRLAVELALLALVAYLAALGVSAGLRSTLDAVPPAPAVAAVPDAVEATGSLADYAVIAERDIFNPPGEAARAGGDPALRLWGVGVQGNQSRAVIEDTTTHRQELYGVGDHVGTARIVAIDWDRVTLARAGGGEEVLELVPPGSAPAERAPAEESFAADGGAREAKADARIRRTGENAFVVDRRELTGAVDNASGLLTQLRAVAEVQDGRPAGFRLFQIRAGSLFARLGLQDGDVVRRVNGTAIAEPTALLGFLSRLDSEPRVALDIVRGDAPRTLVYDLR